MEDLISSEERRSSDSSSPHINFNDPLSLAASDNPGAQLVAFQFNGSNFLNWSRAIRMALGAKYKLGFIDGTCSKSNTGGGEIQRWIRVDYMVRCWMLNSMINSITESFLYVESARELWLEISERYGQSNGILIFQLKRMLIQFVQGTLYVADYFNKLKHYWDELQSLESFPECTCGALVACTCSIAKKVKDINDQNRLMQFLMGLNDIYDGARNQILSMDPIPNLNKAYSLIIQLEAKNSVPATIPLAPIDNSALAAGHQTVFPVKIDYKKEKMDKKCTHCSAKGHLADQCFQLHGIPDWFKALKAKKDGNTVANVSTTQIPPLMDHPLAFDVPGSSTAAYASFSHQFDPSMMNALVQEVLKNMNAQSSAHFASGNFAGPWN